MADVVVDTRSSNYEVLDDPTIAWSSSGPSGRETRVIQVDNSGNSYGLEGGTHVAIRNASGVLTDTIVLPVSTTGQRCYALAVDPQQLAFYVGVSEGGQQERARLWSYEKDPYQGWRIRWEAAPGAFVAKLALSGGLLHAGLNDDLRGRSYVAVYQNIGSVPSELWREQTLHPVTGLSINADGRIATCSGYNSERGYDPRYSGAGQMLDSTFRSYWFDSLTSFSDRVHCILDPAELDLVDGDSVFQWGDTEGSPRILSAVTQQVTVEQNSALFRLNSGANWDDGDTLTLAAADGSRTEIWTARTAPTLAYEFARGANFSAAQTNLEDALRNGIQSTLTPPSSLAYIENVLRLRAFAYPGTPVQPVTIATITSGSSRVNFGEIEGPNGTTARIQREAVVQPTAPTFRKNGMSGRHAVYFDGVSAKMWTAINANKNPSEADEQATLFPGYGTNFVLASSARFAFFMVTKPDPSFVKGCAISQRVNLSGNSSWVRRIVSNRGTDGLYDEGALGVVERDNTTLRTHVADPASSAGVANFSLVSLISNPTGDYEVYFNGSPMNNAVPANTGTAVANDSVARTELGQTSLAGKYEDRFWAGEVNLIVAVHKSDDSPMSPGERQLYEGAIAWYFGAQGMLPNTHPYFSTPPPPPTGSVSDFHTARRALSPFPAVTVLDGKSRDVAWIAASPETGVGTTSGLGSSVAWLPDGHLVSMGVPANASEDVAAVRKIIDLSDDYSTSAADGAWSWDMGALAADTWSYDGLEMAVDEWGNTYVPWFAESATIDEAPPQFLAFDEDGTVFLQPPAERAQACYAIALQKPQPTFNDEDIQRQAAIVLGLRMDPSTTLTMSVLPSNGDQINFSGSVSGSPTVDVYTFVTALATANDVLIGATVAETLTNLAAAINHSAGESTLYGSGTVRSSLVSAVNQTNSALDLVARLSNGDTMASSSTFAVSFDPASPETFAAPDETATQFKLVDIVAELGEGRLRQRVAVVDRSIVVFGQDYVQTTSGGSTVTDASARYWHSVALGRHVFTTDGVNAWATDVRTRTTEPYKATTAGTVPVATPIFEAFRARIVALVGSRAHYSATGDAFDWDYGPGVRQPSQAWNTGLPPSFDIDDVLNGFAAINDDLALIVGDHTLWRLTGDPGPGGNGQYDVLTRSIGGAFGRAWCMGPTGEMYLWTNEGELVVLLGGSELRPVSGSRMRDVCRAIDLRTNFIRMAWNTAADELEIFACPYGGETGSGRWLTWERGVDAWWENEFTGRVVTDAIEVNGDSPTDGVVVAGFSDGWARSLSQSATDDDGTPIHSSVRIGPMSGGDARFDVLLSELQVMLDATGDGCLVEVWGSDTARDFGRARWRRTLRPGVSGVMLPRVRANFVWVVLRGTGAWGFEQMSAFVEAGGLRRRSRLG